MPEEQAAVHQWNEAVAFVAAQHGETLRKGTRIPYITHLMAVAEALAYRYPDRDELIVAGLLHDVVEDTDATVDVVAEQFGERVASLVHAVSKDDGAMVRATGLPVPQPPRSRAQEIELWRRRREFMLDHIRGPHVDPDILRLKAADALANLSAIHRDLRNPAIGSAVWQRFKVGREDSLWFYEQIADAVRDGIGTEPLSQDLTTELELTRSGIDGTGAGYRDGRP
jgi:(p)ppGpp synthase/HD superfamily hydrolase